MKRFFAMLVVMSLSVLLSYGLAPANQDPYGGGGGIAGLLVALIVLAVGVLSIILCYKIWIMCNNVGKIHHNIKVIAHDIEEVKNNVKEIKDEIVKNKQ
jgi:hypothetical protein